MRAFVISLLACATLACGREQVLLAVEPDGGPEQDAGAGADAGSDGGAALELSALAGVWDVQGERLDLGKNPAPRGMDKLEVRRDPQNAELIQVKYVLFMQGRETPVPKT